MFAQGAPLPLPIATEGFSCVMPSPTEMPGAPTRAPGMAEVQCQEK